MHRLLPCMTMPQFQMAQATLTMVCQLLTLDPMELLLRQFLVVPQPWSDLLCFPPSHFLLTDSPEA